VSNIFTDPAKRTEWIFGETMIPCPKCGSYNLKNQTPIKLDISADDEPREIMRKWAKATGELEGPCYIVCWDCKHRGPSFDCSGRTLQDVIMDPQVYAEMKRLWNSQKKH
jgi:hypothetical protein